MILHKILIVDDEPDLRELLSHSLTSMGHQCIEAESINAAKVLLSSHIFFFCLTDMRLPDGDGIDLVKYIKTNYPQLPVAMLTAYGNLEGAVNTLKAGAFDYVSKPIQLDLLKTLVDTALRMSGQDEAKVDETISHEMVGESEVIRALQKDIAKVSRSQAPVFIHGESGVGKELVAKLIHQKSPRANGPFVPVNCGAIPSELMESEFFGHKKGSFTGAMRDNMGLFQSANNGTLFLDEVAELPMHMQVKLLRAIQEKAIRPIGSQREINVDVRIVSATHKFLLDEIDNERFRKDLYYRINVINLNVPPLREHKDDIPLLVEVLLKRLQPCNEPMIGISEQAIDALCDYDFPGNVRELENILERALALCETHIIEISDLHLPEAVGNFELFEGSEEAQLNVDVALDLKQKEAIIAALEKTKWNRTAAAKMLGITFRALRYRIKKFNIE